MDKEKLAHANYLFGRINELKETKDSLLSVSLEKIYNIGWYRVELSGPGDDIVRIPLKGVQLRDAMQGLIDSVEMELHEKQKEFDSL